MNRDQYENKLRAKGYQLIGNGLYANAAAERDNYYFDWEAAIRENEAWNYHHDNYLVDA